jgi:16S rRNA A1518/A1519 N6-dimethyltransferase RsmA/KsgA/DIM1 with predicted DNA glycosylase/AP lyase activity
MHWLLLLHIYVLISIHFLTNMSHFLGQCFLTHQESIDSINNIIKKTFSDHQLVEIWPWPWVMTFFLHSLSDKLKLYELDRSFEKKLAKIVWEDQIVWWDVLQTRSKPTEKTLVYGSLPYYITSPIIRLVCDWIYVTWIFVIQHEVWEKIATTAKKKSYLRWLLNFYYDVVYALKIPRHHFNPAPKVDSCCVTLIPRSNPVGDTELFYQLIWFLDTISWFKRKTLWAIAKMISNQHMLNFLIHQWISWKRLEELDWTEMIELVKNSWS